MGRIAIAVLAAVLIGMAVLIWCWPAGAEHEKTYEPKTSREEIIAWLRTGEAVGPLDHRFQLAADMLETCIRNRQECEASYQRVSDQLFECAIGCNIVCDIDCSVKGPRP